MLALHTFAALAHEAGMAKIGCKPCWSCVTSIDRLPLLASADRVVA
jgi:hypothetical protein